MGKFCIKGEEVKKFIDAIKSGEITPDKLNSFKSSEKRVQFLAKFLSEPKKANILFERKLLNKHKTQALLSWVDELTGITTDKKLRMKELIQKRYEERIKRTFSPEEDELFLKDLVSSRIGVEITEEESKTIFKIAMKIKQSRNFFNKNTIFKELKLVRKLSDNDKKIIGNIIDKLNSKKEKVTMNKKVITKLRKVLGGAEPTDTTKLYIKRLVNNIAEGKMVGDNNAVGVAKRAMQNYIEEITVGGNKTIKEHLNNAYSTFKKAPLRSSIRATAGALKSIKASWDASFIGRQGWKSLVSGHPIIFVKGFGTDVGILLKHLADNTRVLKGDLSKNNKILDDMLIGIYSRGNSVNGIYDKMKIAIGNVEEAIPTTFQEKIPILGRIFKASDDAYLATAYSMRADLADMLIKNATKNGVELTDEVLRGYGKLVNSMTGRGEVLLGKLGEKTNIMFFSPKNAQSHLDFLTAHVFDKDIPLVVKKTAIRNLLVSIGSTTGMIYAINLYLDATGTDAKAGLNPTSSDFGKLIINQSRFDLTAGMGSYITLVARAVAGVYTSSTGIETERGEYGFKSLGTALAMFAENKVSPFARIFVDYYNGQTFNKDAISFAEWKKDYKHMAWIHTKNYLIPIIVENTLYPEAIRQNNPYMTTIIGDFFGVGTSIHTFKSDWGRGKTNENRKLIKKYGEARVNQASKIYDIEINKAVLNLIKSDKYKKADNKKKKSLLSRTKRITKKRIINKMKY